MSARKAVTKKTKASKKSGLRKKTASRVPVRSKIDPEIKNALQAAKPLLGALHKPTPSGYQKAHDTIHDLILSERRRDFSVKDKLLFLLSLKVSTKCLRGYATLNLNHISQINSFVNRIEKYTTDTTQQRPLNFMMLASPGAGKSHFIKCVAARLESKSVSAITFNMAGMEANDDLVPALDSARNLKVEDRLPLLFLDEFDSSEDNFALLLPLLWDGGLNLGQRDLKLGKVIIVMAGSDPAIPKAMDHARSMRAEAPANTGHNTKLIDLFSRVNGGVLHIPPFLDVAQGIDRRTDKVCIASELLRNRFGRSLKQVPLGLLRFIAAVEFRYDVRSIAHLVDMIPYKKSAKKLMHNDLKLPLGSASRLKGSSLAYHLLHEDQAMGVVEEWHEATKKKVMIPIASDFVDRMEGWHPSYIDHYSHVYFFFEPDF